MVAFVLFLLYGSMILLEAILLYRILSIEIKMDFTTALMDTIVVNVMSLAVIIVIFGPTLARLDATGTQIHFFRVMMITWPQEIIKICLFSIVSDALALTLWYRYRYPQLHYLETAVKGALMNVPALIIAGVSWAFVTIFYEFFKFLRVV